MEMQGNNRKNKTSKKKKKKVVLGKESGFVDKTRVVYKNALSIAHWLTLLFSRYLSHVGATIFYFFFLLKNKVFFFI